MFSGSDDGYLTLWQNEKIVQRIQGHKQCPILCLQINEKNGLLVTGGVDGKVNLWSIQPNIHFPFEVEIIICYNLSEMEP